MGIPVLPARRTEITDRSDVELLVRRFYQAVIPDPTLGPIFHDFGVDWSIHIPKLVDFWAGRLLGEPGYVGNAVGAHQPVLTRGGFGSTELARWLELWDETVDELFVGDVADRAKERARLASVAIGTLSDRHAAHARPRTQADAGRGDHTG
jgi:hemoglobin